MTPPTSSVCTPDVPLDAFLMKIAPGNPQPVLRGYSGVLPRLRVGVAGPPVPVTVRLRGEGVSGDATVLCQEGARDFTIPSLTEWEVTLIPADLTGAGPVRCKVRNAPTHPGVRNE